MLVPPVAALLIAGWGVTRAMELIGMGFGAVIIAGGLLSLRCPPGYRPAGALPEARPSVQAPSVADADWRGMLVAPRFPPMLLLLLCGATAAMMVISQSYSIARGAMGLDGAAAAWAVSLMALANTFGRLSAGTASDFFGRTPVLAAGLVVAILGLACLGAAGPDSSGFFFIGLAALGFSFGAFMGVYPGFTAQVFGSRHNSVNFGIMFIGFSAAGVLGPVLMKTISGAGFGLEASAAAAAAVSALGFAALLLYGRAARRA